jgi:hypothetical protein
LWDSFITFPIRYEALYFSVVSVTTVGYGDELCTSPLAKAFNVLYLAVGCVVTAAALADVAAFPVERRRRRHEQKVLRQYGRELNFDDLDDLAHAADDLIGATRRSATQPPSSARGDPRSDGEQGGGSDGGGDDSPPSPPPSPLCTKEQFALVMLLKLGKVRAADVRACLRQFAKLDLDANGTLDQDDLKLHSARRRQRRHARRAARAALSNNQL